MSHVSHRQATELAMLSPYCEDCKSKGGLDDEHLRVLIGMPRQALLDRLPPQLRESVLELNAMRIQMAKLDLLPLAEANAWIVRLDWDRPPKLTTGGSR